MAEKHQKMVIMHVWTKHMDGARQREVLSSCRFTLCTSLTILVLSQQDRSFNSWADRGSDKHYNSGSNCFFLLATSPHSCFLTDTPDIVKGGMHLWKCFEWSDFNPSLMPLGGIHTCLFWYQIWCDQDAWRYLLFFLSQSQDSSDTETVHVDWVLKQSI